jgi:hypothetical protein
MVQLFKVLLRLRKKSGCAGPEFAVGRALRGQSSLPHLGVTSLGTADSSLVVLLLLDLVGEFDCGDHHTCLFKSLEPSMG